MVGSFPSAMRSERRTRLRRRLRRTLLTALVLACLLSLSGGWIGLGGWQSRRHLTNAAELARDLGEQVLAGETAQARRTLTALRQQTAAARGRTGDLSWRMAGHTPYAGVNLTVGHDLAVALDDLAGRAFPALVELDLAGCCRSPVGSIPARCGLPYRRRPRRTSPLRRFARGWRSFRPAGSGHRCAPPCGSYAMPSSNCPI